MGTFKAVRLKMTNFAVLDFKVSVFHILNVHFKVCVLFSTASQMLLSRTDQPAMVPREKKKKEYRNWHYLKVQGNCQKKKIGKQ